MIEGEARFPGGTPLDPRIDYAKINKNHFREFILSILLILSISFFGCGRRQRQALPEHGANSRRATATTLAIVIFRTVRRAAIHKLCFPGCTGEVRWLYWYAHAFPPKHGDWQPIGALRCPLL